MNLAVVTQQIPWGKGEGFIIDELTEFIAQGHRITIFPILPEREVFHEAAGRLAVHGVRRPIVDLYTCCACVLDIVRRPLSFLKVLKVIVLSRNARILAKNLIVLPKAYYIARRVRENKTDHLHAYWGSTSSTAGLIVSLLTGVPYSMTCFRWDIAEDNLLSVKHRESSFVRCHDIQGKREILKICGLESDPKVVVLRAGVHLPRSEAVAARSRTDGSERPFHFLVPALFIPKKGHVFFVEAARLLRDRGHRFVCSLYGQGPLERDLRAMVDSLELAECIRFRDFVPLEQLREVFRSGGVDVVVLPSIVTSDDQREGVPASLVDALSYGIPVISTTTGGIPELVIPGVGVLVEPEDSMALAGAMEYVMCHPRELASMRENGRSWVAQQYDVKKIVSALSVLMANAVPATS